MVGLLERGLAYRRASAYTEQREQENSSKDNMHAFSYAFGLLQRLPLSPEDTTRAISLKEVVCTNYWHLNIIILAVFEKVAVLLLRSILRDFIFGAKI